MKFVSWIELKHRAFNRQGHPADRAIRYLGPPLLLILIGLVILSVLTLVSQIFPLRKFSDTQLLMHASTTTWILMNICFNYFMVMFVDPGTTFEHYRKRQDQVESSEIDSDDDPFLGRYKQVSNRYGQSLLVREEDEGVEAAKVDINDSSVVRALSMPMLRTRFCKKCNITKPPRAHHCGVCRRCVLRMDHHCPWTLSCIGFYNHKYYLAFLLYLFLGCIYVTLMALPIMDKGGAESIPVVVTFVFCGIFSVVMFFFTVYSFYMMIYRGQTQWESPENAALQSSMNGKGQRYIYPYNLGWKKNLHAVFGNGTLWWMLLIPSIDSPPGDGVKFKTAFGPPMDVQMSICSKLLGRICEERRVAAPNFEFTFVVMNALSTLSRRAISLSFCSYDATFNIVTRLGVFVKWMEYVTRGRCLENTARVTLLTAFFVLPADMRTTLFIALALSVSASVRVSVSVDDDVQAVVDAALLNVTSGNVTISLDTNALYLNQHLNISNLPFINFIVSSRAGAVLVNPVFNFFNVGNVTFNCEKDFPSSISESDETAVNFRGGIEGAMITVSESNRLSISFCEFYDVHNGTSITALNVTMVTTNQCTFSGITNPINEPNFLVWGGTRYLSVTNTRFIDSSISFSMFSVIDIDEDSVIIMDNITISNVRTQSLLGVIDLATSSSDVDIRRSAFVNVFVSFGIIKLSHGFMRNFSVTDCQFLSGAGYSLIYSDWYIITEHFLLDNNVFSSILPTVSDLTPGYMVNLSSAIIMISGMHKTIVITNSGAKNCLMGGDAAFIAIMWTFGPVQVDDVTLSNITVVQNQLVPFMINAAISIGSISVRNSTIQFNSAVSYYGQTVFAGAIAVFGSYVGSLIVEDTDMSYNNGPIGAIYVEDYIQAITINNVRAVYNTGRDGAGMFYFYTLFDETVVTVNNSLFYSNTAPNYGAAIRIDAFKNGSGIYNSRFEFNTLTSPYSLGGGVYLYDYLGYDNLFVFDHCVFQSNSAYFGSAIAASCPYRLLNSHFSGHPPNFSVIYDTSRYVYVSKCDFSDFSASPSGMFTTYAAYDVPDASYTLTDNTFSSTWTHNIYCGQFGSIGTYTFKNNILPNTLSENIIRASISSAVYTFASIVIEDNQMGGISPSLFSSYSDHLSHISLKGNGLTSSSFNENTLPPQLKRLDISRNQLTDDIISYIEALTNVVELRLNDNLFTDTSLFVNLPKTITTLDLSGNQYNGSILSLSSLTALELLHIDRNGFVDDLISLTQLTSLRELNASFNAFNSIIPNNISSLSQLVSLDLSHNSNLTAEIPDLSNLTSLVTLNFSNNRINGSLEGLSSLFNLAELDISDNEIVGDLSLLNNLGSLVKMNLSFNEMKNLQGFNLTLMSSTLRHIDISHCDLSGSLPQSFNRLPLLEELLLNDNKIASMSQSDVNMTSLQTLVVSRNRLSTVGDMSIYNAMSSLQILRLDGNNYNSGLERLTNLSLLQSLNVSHNSLGVDVSILPSFPSLQTMDLSFNRLKGNASLLSTQTSLRYLDVSYNNLGGSLGSSILSMHNLTHLNLSHNMITGAIDVPPQLNECDLSVNPYVCPIDWVVYQRCLITCTPLTSSNDTTIRIRITGDVANFNETNFKGRLAQMVNITMDRITIIKITSGSVIIDMSISPPASSDVNQGNSDYVVNYLKSASASDYSKFGIPLLEVSDVPPTSQTTASQINTITVSPDGVASQSRSISGGEVAGIAIGCTTVVLIAIIVTIVIVTMRRRKAMNTNDIALEEQNMFYDVIDRSKFPSRDSIHVNGMMDSLSTEKAQLIKKIGAYGIVWQASYRGNIVAMKQIKTPSMDVVESFMVEVELMKRLIPHTNVVSFLGFCARPLALITEFVSGGSLDVYLEKHHKNMTITDRISIVLGVAQGMGHLAQERVLHKDLAARNVLLTEDLVPKVTDFGLSRMLEVEAEIHQSKTNVGPIKWMAPESLRGQFSEKSDVWAWGVLCIEVFTGTQPFPHLTATEFVVGVVNDNLHSKMVDQIEMKEDLDPKFVALLESALHLDAAQRPTFVDIAAVIRCLYEKNEEIGGLKQTNDTV
ncbi:hypothetical protein PROFUN_07816 [Planoprotostelium fungivorum]|uniref:Protein kinase domain-containing protein n=1 Tax=Planoprotostelium fungivorum TaxID=1890364 RepID=A0A2P6MX64_9EUKA|nr:hypothetical protein PROFUN_07816 [Planoprotostelium fungivorum]